MPGITSSQHMKTRPFSFPEVLSASFSLLIRLRILLYCGREHHKHILRPGGEPPKTSLGLVHERAVEGQQQAQTYSRRLRFFDGDS